LISAIGLRDRSEPQLGFRTTSDPGILNEDTTMTIEEQLESLTRSVELIAQMQAKTEKEIRTLGRYIRAIVLDHEARLLVLEQEDKSED
jgi:hypothetical protein